jgi:hypothetical protein
MTLIRRTEQQKRVGVPMISIDYKRGQIQLSKELSRIMSLNTGDKVAFYQDDKEKYIWYIKKEKEGLPIAGKMSNPNTRLSSMMISKDICSSIGSLCNVRIPVSRIANGDGMYELITLNHEFFLK